MLPPHCFLPEFISESLLTSFPCGISREGDPEEALAL